MLSRVASQLKTCIIACTIYDLGAKLQFDSCCLMFKLLFRRNYVSTLNFKTFNVQMFKLWHLF